MARFHQTVADLLREPPRDYDTQVTQYCDSMRVWQHEVKAEGVAVTGHNVDVLVAHHKRQDDRDAQHPLHHHILARIREKRCRFTAREWLFTLVREWLDDAMKFVPASSAGTRCA